LRDLFAALQQWKRQTSGEVKTPKGLLPWAVPLIGTPGEATVPDLVTIGDFWLTLAIRQELLQPIEVKKIPSWSALDPKLRALVTRNEKGELTAEGQVWGMPYRMNSTVLVYRKDIFADRKLPLPTDWDDLWRSDLKGRFSLLDQPREVIGLTLKMLGKSYNTEDLAAVPDLKSKLAQLHHNAKFYSSTHYLQPLTLDQTWLAMASSTDALLMMRRNPKLASVFPKSGTALSADRAVQISQLTGGLSPMLAQMSAESLPEELRRNPVLRPEGDSLKNSEYLLPLREQRVDQWRSVWEMMRND
jgi:putative spermidine/putrescine transport system substrate-binding protein